jgi:hypothetical protein
MRRYSGRDFSDEDMQLIAELIKSNPKFNRAQLSRQVCERLDWRRPDGRLREMSCRVAMLRMQADGLIVLPASKLRQPRQPATPQPTPATDPGVCVSCAVHELGPLKLQMVVGGSPASRLWNEYVARYHYLGYKPMSGSQIRYSVYAGGQLVALISFGASAWKLADRERFIGWDAQQRQRNLQLVVNNARFLILPWIRCKGLASKILGMAARQLPIHWRERYGYEPVLLETFVESPRHQGTCYKAANWIRVGRTTGRGKLSTSHQPTLPAKDIWLCPLRRDFADVLTR